MASGKTASVQAAFDKRIRTLAMPMQANKASIQRGFMVQAQAMPGYAANASGRFRFNYLYNPSTVEAMYTIQSSSAGLSYLFPNAGDTGDLAVPINQSVSWTVMFDRTYELNGGSYSTEGVQITGSTAVPAPGNVTCDPTVYGVWADVLQMQYFTGMMLQGGAAQNASGIIDVTPSTSGNYSATFKANQGFMMMIPCWAFFGASNQSINYYGYISEWDVTYTHWTQWMVPMRCVMDISFNMLPPPVSKGTANTAGYYAPTATPGGTGVYQINPTTGLPTGRG